MAGMPSQRLARWIALLAEVVSGRAPVQERDSAYQLQIYAIAWISLLISAVCYVPVYALWLDEPVGAMAIAVSAAAGLATLPLYLITRSVRLALQVMSTAIFVVTSYLTWRQGGLSSPVAPWLLIVPFALSVAGIQGPATIWFIVVIAEMFLLGALELAGYSLPAHRGTDQRVLYVVSHPGLCVLIYAFLFLVNRARRLTLADLHSKNLELSQARDLAMSAVREKSRFLANMSHEIRTPLNGVIGTADILAGTSLSADQRHFVTMLKQSGDSLLVLINDVLDFSKIEAGKVTLEQAEVDLRELVESVAELFAPRAAEKGLVCTCRMAPEVPSRLLGDPHRLRQILTNLLSNSIKFTASGDVALEVTSSRVPGSDDIDVCFRISDTGIGIDEKARDRLFEAFCQGDETTTRVFGGTGLGLAISSELIRLMGSRLFVESEPGRGSCFWFSLRRPATATVPGVAGAPGHVPHLQAVGILEKHPRSRSVLAELLESMGSRPVVFDSPSVLAAAILGNTCPHVCIVDVAQMQDTPWEDLLRRPAPGPPARLPRIFVTTPFGQTDPQVPGIGIAGVISHPIRRAAVEQALLGSEVIALRPPSATEPDEVLERRVLLVEDNPVNRHIATAILKRLGCEVEIALDGEEAIRIWKEGAFDIVLMDCQMPVMDGYDAAREIRAHEAARGLPRTPLIALTANALAGDRELCLEAGMDDHLGKPFTQDLLLAALDRWARTPAVRTLRVAGGAGG